LGAPNLEEVIMSTAISVLAILAIGYIIGSIPTAQIMMRLFHKQDLRKVGTGNITSTAIMIHGSKVAGSLSLLGEIIKTLFCLYIAYLMVGELWAYLLILMAASVGEIWSIWLGGAGGRGQTIFVTGFLVLCPVPFLISVACLSLLLLTTRRFFLSNTIWHLVAPLIMLLGIRFNPTIFGQGELSWGYAATCAVLCALFLKKNRVSNDDILQSQAWGTYSR
jgi:glycerol-3-phosphate acyltransferase PlsY